MDPSLFSWDDESLFPMSSSPPPELGDLPTTADIDFDQVPELDGNLEHHFGTSPTFMFSMDVLDGSSRSQGSSSSTQQHHPHLPQQQQQQQLPLSTPPDILHDDNDEEESNTWNRLVEQWSVVGARGISATAALLRENQSAAGAAAGGDADDADDEADPVRGSGRGGALRVEASGSPSSASRSRRESSNWVVVTSTCPSSSEAWEALIDCVEATRGDGQHVLLLPRLPQTLVDALTRLGAAQEKNGAKLLRAVVEELRELTTTLGLPLRELLEAPLHKLEDTVRGIMLAHRVMPSESSGPPPRSLAQMLALGERMFCTLVVAFMAKYLDKSPQLLDAKRFLVAQDARQMGELRFLNATCVIVPNRSLRRRLERAWGDDDAGGPPALFVCPANVAGTRDNEPAVLQAQDLSCAYFASMLQAQRVEVWTEMEPASFMTADPAVVKDAQVLESVSYSEAVELSTLAKQSPLHPSCLPLLQTLGTPIHLGSLSQRLGQLTCIEPPKPSQQVRAVFVKERVVVISIDEVSMYQQVGFLARVFVLFSKNNVSIDSVSTSETNVTVSLDSRPDEDTLRRLLTDLRPICEPTVRLNCFAVCVIGHTVRPPLDLFDNTTVHLISSAACTFTVVFEAETQPHAHEIVRAVHTQLL